MNCTMAVTDHCPFAEACCGSICAEPAEEHLQKTFEEDAQVQCRTSLLLKPFLALPHRQSPRLTSLRYACASQALWWHRAPADIGFGTNCCLTLCNADMERCNPGGQFGACLSPPLSPHGRPDPHGGAPGVPGHPGPPHPVSTLCFAPEGVGGVPS